MDGSSTPGSNTADPDLPLLPRVARGDAAACRLLVERRLPQLERLTWRMLGERAAAEDVCQEVFLRAWQQAAHWRPQGVPFAGWLARVALNLCRDRLRARRDGPGLDEIELRSDAPRPDTLAEQSDLRKQVHAAVQALPIRQREALTLCHFEGYGNIEAAQLLDISVEALESLLGRARRSLRLTLAAWRTPASRSRSS